MKTKNLVIFMPSIEGGGVEKNLFIISEYLTKKVEKISLITVSNSFRHKFKKKIKIVSLKSKFWDKIGRRKKFIVCLFLLFLEVLNNKNILVFCFQGNLYCTLLCKLLGIKIIVRSNSSPEGWSQNFFKKLCFKYILKLPEEVIVNSLEFKKKFKKNFNINAKCIYNPLNKNEIKYLSKKKNNFRFKRDKNILNIINIGRFTDQKDQITILKAINILKNKFKLKLIIIGRGVKKNLLLKYVKYKKLNNLVKILPFQNNPYNILKSSDLFILSSKFEGLPNVLLEAQVLKKFIISSDCPTGPKEILMNGKAGFLYKIGDYKKLAKLILLFQNNREKLNSKINFGYKNLHRFDYNKNLNKYYYLIKKHI